MSENKSEGLGASAPRPPTDWDVDCMHYFGRVLTGRSAHFCPDWDFLPIDETTPEFESCTCEPRAAPFEKP